MFFSLFCSLPKRKIHRRMHPFLLQDMIFCWWLLFVTSTCSPYLCQNCRRRCSIVGSCDSFIGCIPDLRMRGSFRYKQHRQRRRALGRVYYTFFVRVHSGDGTRGPSIRPRLHFSLLRAGADCRLKMAGLAHSQPAVAGRLGLARPGGGRLARFPIAQAPLRQRQALQRSLLHHLGA